MSELTSRRRFIRKSTTACTGICLLAGSNLKAITALLVSDEEIDPKALNYCGYVCPDDCKFKKATLLNDIDLKKEAYADWHIKEQYNIDFDSEKIFCKGCKTTEEPLGVVAANCTVRSCAIDKEYESCIQCEELEICDENLWKRFPDFQKMMIELQQKFQGNVKA